MAKETELWEYTFEIDIVKLKQLAFTNMGITIKKTRKGVNSFTLTLDTDLDETKMFQLEQIVQQLDPRYHLTEKKKVI